MVLFLNHYFSFWSSFLYYDIMIYLFTLSRGLDSTSSVTCETFLPFAEDVIWLNDTCNAYQPKSLQIFFFLEPIKIKENPNNGFFYIAM